MQYTLSIFSLLLLSYTSTIDASSKKCSVSNYVAENKAFMRLHKSTVTRVKKARVFQAPQASWNFIPQEGAKIEDFLNAETYRRSLMKRSLDPAEQLDFVLHDLILFVDAIDSNSTKSRFMNHLEFSVIKHRYKKNNPENSLYFNITRLLDLHQSENTFKNVAMHSNLYSHLNQGIIDVLCCFNQLTKREVVELISLKRRDQLENLSLEGESQNSDKTAEAFSFYTYIPDLSDETIY